MSKAKNDPIIVKSEDIEPGFNWDQAIPAPVHMAVDFEERVNFRRLHDYRLGRSKQALAESKLGAIMCLDANNIRYISGTVIGEWSRDKMSRYALLTGTGDPHIWDFGSAASHHRLHMPWLPAGCVHAGMLGLRGAVPPDAGLMKKAAQQVQSIMIEHGVADMPLGVDIIEPSLFYELQELGIEVRDAQQTMLNAREIKNIDEIVLLNQAAAMVDGVYHQIF